MNKFCVIELENGRYLSGETEDGTDLIQNAATFCYPLVSNFKFLTGYICASNGLKFLEKYKIKVVEYKVSDYDLDIPG